MEDSPSARRLLQALFLRLGIELPNLRMVATEQEALQVFTQWDPDIVFLDLELSPVPAAVSPASAEAGPAKSAPPVDGRPRPGGADLAIQFLKRNPAIQIVVCSARDPSDSPLASLIREGRIQGMVKPVLAAKVQAALARAAPKSVGIPRTR